MAQLVEEVSIVASEMRRRKPREVPRPKHLRRDHRETQRDAAPARDPYKKAVGVLAATSRTVRRAA